MLRIRHTNAWPTRYKVGMWAWILHRVTGVIIALYGVAHLSIISTSRNEDTFDRLMDFFHKPYLLALELVLLAAILYHILNGFRVLLFDFGIGVRHQKALFWGLMVVGVIIFALAAWAIVPEIAE